MLTPGPAPLQIRPQVCFSGCIRELCRQRDAFRSDVSVELCLQNTRGRGPVCVPSAPRRGSCRRRQEAASQARLPPPSVLLARRLSRDLSFPVCSPAVSGAPRKQSVC